jgi:hypothetical protein
MMAKSKRSNELKDPTYEIFIAILSVLSIVDLVWAMLTPYETVATVMWVMNAVMTTVFLIDFIMRLVTAESKAEYFWRQYGWADILSCLPVQQLKIFRVFRLFRAYRLTKKYGIKNMAVEMVENRAQSVLLTLLLCAILVFQFGSMLMLNFESTAPNGNIKTASDALWYTIVTISTVGYGDRYPVTNAGRVTGSIIILIGVGLFGTFTGYLANWFLTPKKARPEEEAAPEPAPGNGHVAAVAGGDMAQATSSEPAQPQA